MPGVISSIGKPIFEKSRVKWSVGFALGFLATLCGGVCVTAISWAQPKPSCRCWLCRQPASLASLEGRAPCGTHGAAPPLGPGPAGFGFSPVQTRALSARAAALLTHPHLLCPLHRVLPPHIASCPSASPLFSAALAGRAGGQPWDSARGRGREPLGGRAGAAGGGCGCRSLSRGVRVCMRAHTHVRTYARTHAPALLRACVGAGCSLSVSGDLPRRRAHLRILRSRSDRRAAGPRSGARKPRHWAAPPGVTISGLPAGWRELARWQRRSAADVRRFFIWKCEIMG